MPDKVPPPSNSAFEGRVIELLDQGILSLPQKNQNILVQNSSQKDFSSDSSLEQKGIKFI